MGTLSVLTLLMVLIPSALGSGTSIGFKAPYSGSVSLSSYFSSSGCGGHAKQIAPPQFDLQKGSGGFSAASSARSCGSGFHTSGASSSGMAGGGMDVAVKVGVPSSGLHWVNASWTFTANGFTSLTPGTCSVPSTSYYGDCARSVSAMITGYASLVDTSTGQYYFSTNVWAGVTQASSVDYYCTYGSCTSSATVGSPGPFAVSSKFTWTFSVSLQKGHHYLLVTSFSGGTQATVSCYAATLSGASGSVGLNFAHLGGGAKLTGVTVQ
ncbi:MAG: hypothetical protein L3K19_02475 [Thermoplasmata archaeon]|nr:hypothetical protein [Thermoplasmata archaeon]